MPDTLTAHVSKMANNTDMQNKPINDVFHFTVPPENFWSKPPE